MVDELIEDVQHEVNGGILGEGAKLKPNGES